MTSAGVTLVSFFIRFGSQRESGFDLVLWLISWSKNIKPTEQDNDALSCSVGVQGFKGGAATFDVDYVGYHGMGVVRSGAMPYAYFVGLDFFFG